MNTPTSPTKMAGTIRHRLMLVVDEFKAADRVSIQSALALAEEAHQKQYRRQSRHNPNPKRGIPYIVHPMRVALIVIEELELKDPAVVIAALLHDIIEAKRDKYSVADIESKFGRGVAMMVSILTRPPQAAGLSAEEKDVRNKMYYKRVEQASVVSRLLKLADRLDSMREAVDWMDAEEQKEYLEETREFYLPMAENTDSYLLEELQLACDALEGQIKYS